MAQATQTTTTSKAPTHARRQITANEVANLLRYDADANTLHWLAKPRGKHTADLRAGYDLKRDGKVIGRAVTIQGVRYRHGHVAHLLQTGAWPVATRGHKAKAPIAASAPTAPILAPLAPIVATPREVTEIARAVIATAPKDHRGWLFGMARRA